MKGFLFPQLEKMNRYVPVLHTAVQKYIQLFQFSPTARPSSTAETKFLHADILRNAATLAGMRDKRALSWKMR
jgi:hypothetical protein